MNIINEKFWVNLLLIAYAVLLNTDAIFAASCKKSTERYVSQSAGCLDKETGIVWGEAMGAGGSLKAAQDFCALSYGGKNEGWRLPTHQELREVSRGTISDVIGWEHPNHFFWTQTSPMAKFALLIKPSMDASEVPEEAFEDPETFKGGIACVRQAFGCQAQSGEYKTSQGGCRQEAARLVWSSLSSGPLTYDGIKEYCNDLRQGGANNWTLPKASELLSLGEIGMNAVFGKTLDEAIWSADTKTAWGTIGFMSTNMYHARMLNLKSGSSVWIPYHIIGSFPPQPSELHPTQLARVVCVKK